MEATNDRKDYASFLEYYEKAAALYEEQKDEARPDDTMQTLEDQYQKLLTQGW